MDVEDQEDRFPEPGATSKAQGSAPAQSQVRVQAEPPKKQKLQ